MLTPSQLKLIELLKTDEQVRELIKKLEFGCRILVDKGEGKEEEEIIIREIVSTRNSGKHFNPCKEIRIITNYGSDLVKDFIAEGQIIGLPLSEHFIRLYCENKKIDIVFRKEFLYINCPNVYVGNKGFVIKIDHTRDFNSQSDECYNSIYEALLSLT